MNQLIDPENENTSNYYNVQFNSSGYNVRYGYLINNSRADCNTFIKMSFPRYDKCVPYQLIDPEND
jgi:hypothetical protein